MNMESLVTACHHRAVNTSLLLAHTANSFKFQSCDRTPQAASLTASLRHFIRDLRMNHLASIVYGWDYPGI